MLLAACAPNADAKADGTIHHPVDYFPINPSRLIVRVFLRKVNSKAHAILWPCLMNLRFAKTRKARTLKLFADADHSFHVPARTGPKGAQGSFVMCHYKGRRALSCASQQF